VPVAAPLEFLDFAPMSLAEIHERSIDKIEVEDNEGQKQKFG
jgi:hypothetical protein